MTSSNRYMWEYCPFLSLFLWLLWHYCRVLYFRVLQAYTHKTERSNSKGFGVCSLISNGCVKKKVRIWLGTVWISMIFGDFKKTILFVLLCILWTLRGNPCTYSLKLIGYLKFLENTWEYICISYFDIVEFFRVAVWFISSSLEVFSHKFSALLLLLLLLEYNIILLAVK